MQKNHNVSLVEIPIIIADLQDRCVQLEAKLEDALKVKQCNDSNPYEHLTRKDIKEQYRISYGTIHKHMNSGLLPYSKVGRKTLFKRVDIECVIKKA